MQMVPKLVLKIIKSTVMKDVKRRRKLYPPHGLYNEKLHIPYILLYTKRQRKTIFNNNL